ncbi:MAG: hypothetical protein JXA13_08820 [Anaerolineales bacterium]|nr:hypothetical protein [Anaerolineales bacterium]
MRPSFALTLVITVLSAVVSLAGVLHPDFLYPSKELRQSFLVTGLINLFLGLPVLLASAWLTLRGKLLALLFWPRALFFFTNHFIVYTFGMPINMFFPFYPLLMVLSAWATVLLAASIDWQDVRDRMAGKAPVRFPAGLLVLFGTAFFLRAGWMLLGQAPGKVVVSTVEMPALISGILIAPVWVIGGVSLWRRRLFGYVSSVGLLFQASMLFIGLIVFQGLLPVLTEAVPDPWAVFQAALMGMVCFVPFGHYFVSRADWVRGSMEPASKKLIFSNKVRCE